MINNEAQKVITSLINYPLPLSYILANDIFCSWCFVRSDSQKSAYFILSHGGLCENCNKLNVEDHISKESVEGNDY